MSLMTHAYLIDKYGPRMNVDQLAEMMSIAPATIYNRISSGRFPIKTYIEGKMRYADLRDVVEYFDQCRSRSA
jgi:predicted DNA-binding transcriptional regulator AlpA